jgi:adhesin HecA-like repeat protein
LLNDAAIIESGRNLTVDAGSFVNRRGPLTISHINYGDAAPANAVNCRHEHGFCEATAQIESTGPAQLNAARNLTLTAQSFLNDASLVSAGANLDIEAQVAATNATRILTTSWHGHWREWRGWLRGYKDHDEFGQSVTGQTPAVIQAGGQVTLRAPMLTNSGNVQANGAYLGGGAITNGITDFSHQTPGSTLPDSGISLANSALFGSSGFSGQLGDSLLFAPQANGNSSQFVYSGPPAPPNLISLTQEDLLNALPEHLRPGGSTPPKFLLDPQAEAAALRQAALDQTGRAYFVNGLAYDDQFGYSLDTQQRQVLYANAAQFASTYDIAFGKALTAEQIAKLTQPILWYVDQQVSDARGNQIHAYVPTVYLPQVMQGQLANIAGGVIRGNDVTLSTRDESLPTDLESQILNTGFITAARYLTLDTEELRNEKRSADIGEIHQAEEDGYFKLTGDTVQPGGFLSAADLQINADRVHSLSGEFKVVGESDADTQAKSAAFVNAMRERLGSNYSEETNRDHISSEWVQVSKPDPWAQVVVIVAAVVISIYTAGAASALIASATNAAAGSAFAVGGLGNVMLTSALTSMASATVTGALTGHLSLNDVLLAGVTGAATGFVGAEVGGWGTATQNGQTVVTDWSAHAATIATRAGTQAAFNQLRGGDLGDSFANALISGLAAEGANAIGMEFGPAGQGSPAHSAAHAALGAGISALRGGDIIAGALGGAASAVLSPLLDPYTSSNETVKAMELSALSTIAGAAVTQIAGHSAVTGAEAALNEIQNNYIYTLKQYEQLRRACDAGNPAACATRARLAGQYTTPLEIPRRAGYEMVVNVDAQGRPAAYSAYNAITKEVDYVMDPTDLPSFVRSAGTYRLVADYERLPPYAQQSGNAAWRLSQGILNLDLDQSAQGLDLVGQSWVTAAHDPSWWTASALSLGMGGLGGIIAKSELAALSAGPMRSSEASMARSLSKSNAVGAVSSLDNEIAALKRIANNAPATRDLDDLINLKGEAQQFADVEWRAGRSSTNWNNLSQDQKLEWLAKTDAKINLNAEQFFATKHGADNGFDFAFWKVENGKPQLYVPEVKDRAGVVSENQLSSYGVGTTSSGQERSVSPGDRFYLKNKDQLERSINSSDLPPSIKVPLLDQLRRDQYNVILYGNQAKSTSFSQGAIDALTVQRGIPDTTLRSVPLPSKRPE